MRYRRSMTGAPWAPLADRYSDERFARIADRIDALQILLTQRADASDIALQVAKSTLNEMRGMAMDQQLSFVTKIEYSSKHDALISRTEKLEQAVISIESVAKGGYWTAIAIGSLIAAVISWSVSLFMAWHR